MISKVDGWYFNQDQNYEILQIRSCVHSKSSFTKLSCGSEMIWNAIEHILLKENVDQIIAPLTSGNRQCTSLAVVCQVYNHTARLSSAMQ